MAREGKTCGRTRSRYLALHSTQQVELEWLNLGNLTRVELASESPDFPIN
jgi:hypothetical protein